MATAAELVAAAEDRPLHLTMLDGMVADYLFYVGATEEPLNGEASEGYAKYSELLAHIRVRAATRRAGMGQPPS